MMAQSTRDTYNYGQYLNQFPPNTIKVIREFERIQKKICRHKMSIMFNEICINEEMLPKYTYMCVCVCVCMKQYPNGGFCWFCCLSSSVDSIVNSHTWPCGHFPGCIKINKNQTTNRKWKEETDKNGFRTANPEK